MQADTLNQLSDGNEDIGELARGTFVKFIDS